MKANKVTVKNRKFKNGVLLKKGQGGSKHAGSHKGYKQKRTV